MSTQDAKQATTLHQGVRTVAAAAMVAAGIIHFAYTPVHLDVAISHGMFFLVAGWLQLALAAGLALRIGSDQLWLRLTVLVNAAIVGVWIVSRTVGVPGSDRESVGLPDVAATALEVLAVCAAVALLSGRLADRDLTSLPTRSLAGLGTVATITLVSLAVSPSFAGEHSPGAHGHSSGSEGAAVHQHSAGAVNPDDWAEIRLTSLEGHTTPEQVEAFKQLEADYLSQQIRDRSRRLRTMPEAEREDRIAAYVQWAVDNTMSLLEGAQHGGDKGMHTHGPVEWQPITSPSDQLALQGQLEAAGQVIKQYPTVADAEAAGYRQIAPYVPGIAAHWIKSDLIDDKFDPAAPEMLLFNGTEPTSQLVGLSYATIGDQPPEGFVGDNDVWHNHPRLCLLGGFVVGIDGTPEDLCESIGGSIANQLGDLQMAHLWQVPGWENPWGLFAAENPNVNVATSDLGKSLVQ